MVVLLIFTTPRNGLYACSPKRRLIDTGQKLLLEEDEDLTEIQNKLEKERRTRMALEERVR